VEQSWSKIAYLLVSYHVTSLGKPLVVVDNQRDLCYTQHGNLTDPKPNSNPNI